VNSQTAESDLGSQSGNPYSLKNRLPCMNRKKTFGPVLTTA